jgi:hypothetical protein
MNLTYKQENERLNNFYVQFLQKRILHKAKAASLKHQLRLHSHLNRLLA